MDAAPIDRHLTRYGWIWLLGLAALALLPGLGGIPLLDRDEPRFVRATVEMQERGNWVVPYFNEAYRFDKPPLTYWWMQLNFRLLGEGEFAARLHSIIAAWAAALGIFAFGRSLFCVRSGWLAGAAFLLCFQTLVHGRLAVADMPMIAAVAIIMWMGWELVHERHWAGFSWRFWALWWAVIIGFLAKGPIVLFVPVLAWLLFAITSRSGARWNQLQPLAGLGFALIVVGLWGAPALILTGGAFWDVGIGTHIVERGTQTFNGRISNPLYYVVTIFVSLMPWTAFLWAWVAKVRRGWDARTAYLLMWFLAPVLIFSFYATQLLHYILPGFAGFLLVLFRPVKSASARPALADTHPLSAVKNRRAEAIFYRTVHTLWSVVTVVLWALVIALPFPGETGPLRGVLGGLALVLTGLLILGECTRHALWRRLIPGFAFALLLVGTGFAAFAHNLRPTLPALKLEPWFAAAKAETSDLEWTGHGYSEPSLVYYREGPWRFAGDPESDTDFTRGAHVVLAREWRIDDLLDTWLEGRTTPKPSTDRPDALPPTPPG
ncbi:MAG: ArnT family glycosyltransferase, partial [Opitutales bacterium]